MIFSFNLKIFFFNKLPSFLFLLVPLSLISGPFLSDFSVSLSALIFLFYTIKYKEFAYFKNIPLILFFIFCLYCVMISTFIAKDSFLSFQSSLFYFRIGVFSCVVWYLIDYEKKILKYFYYTLFLCFSILVIDGYFQYYMGYNTLGGRLFWFRVSSFFGDELILGSYMARLTPLFFALFLLRKHSRTEIILAILLLILTTGLIFISGERTAFFFHLLSMIFIVLLTKKLKFIKYLILGSVIIIIVIFSLSNTGLKKRMLNAPINLMDINKNAQYIFTPAHDSLMRTAYKMFLDKPVFGHGPKMFRVICKDEKYATGASPCMTHPHNFYIQLLAETGIIGFLFLFCALSYVIYCSLRQLKNIIFKEQRYLTNYQVCLLACLLITVWPLSPNGNFFNNWLMICYSLPVGFYLHSIYGKNRKEVLKE